MFPWVLFIIVILICLIQNVGPFLGPIVGLGAIAFGVYHGLREQSSQADKIAGWAFAVFGIGLLFLIP